MTRSVIFEHLFTGNTQSRNINHDKGINQQWALVVEAKIIRTKVNEQLYKGSLGSNDGIPYHCDVKRKVK